jgi:hypothetical protein
MQARSEPVMQVTDMLLDARELQTINSEGSRKYRLLELEGRRDR